MAHLLVIVFDDARLSRDRHCHSRPGYGRLLGHCPATKNRFRFCPSYSSTAAGVAVVIDCWYCIIKRE